MLIVMSVTFVQLLYATLKMRRAVKLLDKANYSLMCHLEGKIVKYEEVNCDE